MGLRKMLKQCGAHIPTCLVFAHPNKEPWRTIGVFLKIAGKNPERSPYIGRFYDHFGHTKSQQDEAARFGRLIGKALKQEVSLAEIDFQSPTALP